jgi:hypothetical protein
MEGIMAAKLAVDAPWPYMRITPAKKRRAKIKIVEEYIRELMRWNFSIESHSNRNKYLSFGEWNLFLLKINGRRHKSIDSVCFKPYCAGLSVESIERKLSMRPVNISTM